MEWLNKVFINKVFINNMSININRLIVAGLVALSVTACTSRSTPPTTSAPSPSASPAPAASPAPTASAPAKAAVAKHGGQVVQMGDYHLELLAIPEGENMHVDFWLLKASDATSLGDAKVTATVQFPNGTQKTVDMTYDEPGKHYKAYISGYTQGEYRVVVQTEHQSKKVNGRFNFKL